MATSKTGETTAKKTTAKKATPKAVVAKPAKAATTKTTSRKKVSKLAVITSEDRLKMIEEAAYYIAEKNGFGSNHMDYWLQAEQEIDAKLNA